MSDYRNQSKKECGYLYGGMGPKWPEIETGVMIKTGTYIFVL